MSKSLLIVEDDTLLATHTARALQRHGYQTHVAQHADEALALIRRLSSLDAAVLDQNLGEDNGLQLITPIRQAFPHCRIIILTGYGSISAAVSATHQGAHNYLTKPANAQEIIHALDNDPTQQHLPMPDTPPSLQRLEWEHIQRTLDNHGGNISRAAEALGIHRRTLQRRLKKRPSARDYQRDKPSNEVD